MATQTREEALDFLKKTLEKLGFEFENVSEDTPINESMDSLDVVEFCMELEKTLDVSITDNSMESWETFKDIIDTYLIVTENEK